MKKLVLLIFILNAYRLFPAFEIDILGQLAAATSFPALDSQTVKVNGSTEARPDFSIQIGYQFPINKGLKGFSLLFDLGASSEIIGIAYPGNQNLVNKETGLNVHGGAAFKFIIGSVNSLVPRDTVIGFGLGAKFMLFTPDMILSSFPITPYAEAFVEQRFFISRSLALVLGLNVSFDYMIFSGDDVHQLFMGYYVTTYTSLGVGISVGLHFGS